MLQVHKYSNCDILPNFFIQNRVYAFRFMYYTKCQHNIKT